VDCGPPPVLCGDFLCDPGEAAANCPSDCTGVVTPPCGDGKVERGEECDDGNAIETDACRSSCQWNRCGDGVVRAGVEECDDGNATDNDACSAVCLLCNGGNARGSVGDEHHCFTRYDTALDWTAARDACAVRRQHLATFASVGESDLVSTTVLAGVFAWLGLSDIAVEGTWRWVTGEQLAFSGWQTGQPDDASGNEDCGMNWNGNRWNDANCASSLPYVCEDDGFTRYAGHAYRFVYRQASWTNAQADCVSLGGHLATITNEGEQRFLDSQLGTSTSWWIGLTDGASEGTFTWSTGETSGYTHWNPGEPNDFGAIEDCVHLIVQTGFAGLWNDADCAGPKGYICEVD
jgi:cysteine-rich repeat protein